MPGRAVLLPFSLLSLAVVLTVLLASCSKAQSPFAPDAQSSRFLGTWRGTITSDAIGPGLATVIFDFQFGSEASPLLSGTWSLAFTDPTFSTSGTVSASLDTTGTMLVLFFTRGAVPCPGELGSIAQLGIAAGLTFSGNRMRGSYIAAGCPGGTLDLVRL